MSKYFILCSILLFFNCLGAFPQGKGVELTLEQSVEMLRDGNRSLKIADKEIELAKNERQRLNAFWYPSVTATGAYVHMSNKIEVKQPLNQFTDPAKDFIHSIIPDDQIISSILDKIGSYSLHFPLAPQDVTTIDGNVMWPVFTGGKRIYAGKIGKTMVSMAETNKEQVSADMQILLIESYFGLRLGQKVVDVREETFRSLEAHYRNALKLEANGMINKAERLFVQVNMDEAKRELEAARKELGVAQNALKALIKMEEERDVVPVSPLFINDALPPVSYFKSLVKDNNYLVNQLRLQENIAENELKIGRTGYIPNIALFGKHTFYAHGIEKNLVPRSMVGVGFSWNIFDGLDREKRIRQAKISRQTLVLGRDKAIADLEVALDKFYSQTQNALDNVTALNTTIEMSEELVRIRKKSFTEGMATSTEVVDAEVMLSKVQIASLLAYYQYDVALINLLSVCGIPDSFYRYSEEGKNEHHIFNN
ncbi:MAG: TolC family protein [Bacteroidales bacterium]|nr:TolC family protein [Bacteroidales bacterium]